MLLLVLDSQAHKLDTRLGRRRKQLVGSKTNVTGVGRRSARSLIGTEEVVTGTGTKIKTNLRGTK